MCTTTDLPAAAAAAKAKKRGNSGSPSSTPSTLLTPLSIKQRNGDYQDASDGALFHNHDSSTASAARARVVHQRRPSVVQSDFGMDDDGGGRGDDDDSYSSNISAHNINNFCAHMVLLPAVCQGDQLDIFMACRHPLEMLGMQHAAEEEYEGGDALTYSTADPSSNSQSCSNNNNTNNRVSGYHAIPTNCEYCGSPDIAECHPGCQRPPSFFPNQRPPFCPRGGDDWDVRDCAISREEIGGDCEHDKKGAYARADKPPY